MSPPRDAPDPSSLLARYTPDSRRWRRRIAGIATVGAPVALYATIAIVSGVKSGFAYTLLVLLFGLLTMILPAVAAVTVLAPNSGLPRRDAPRTEDAVESLKRRYATGEIDQEEFDRRLGDLMGVADADSEQVDGDSVGSHAPGDGERELTSQ